MLLAQQLRCVPDRARPLVLFAASTHKYQLIPRIN
jgi:hypothetical protein